MAKKQFFLGVDVETSIKDRVVDFGAAVVDRNGEIHAQCAIMVGEVWGVEDLFHNRDAADSVWSKNRLQSRMASYAAMLDSGTRMLASTNAINRWLEKVAGKYDPELFAYNLAFDTAKCRNTRIDLSMFKRRFCLWQASVGVICQTKKYREFILANHLFNAPTDKGNMTYRTDAEAVTGFLTGQMTEEPHTSIEDLIGYEIPTLKHVLTKRDWRDKMTAYDWKKFQVRDHFKAG